MVKCIFKLVTKLFISLDTPYIQKDSDLHALLYFCHMTTLGLHVSWIDTDNNQLT